MHQPSIFDAPISPAPSRGTTDRSREASRSGARTQVKVWRAKTSALLQVLANGGPMTRNELAVVLGWPISSVCSQLAAQMRTGRIVSNGDYQIVTWDDGQQSKRERFRIR